MKGFIQASFDNERSFLKCGGRVGVLESGTETNWGGHGNEQPGSSYWCLMVRSCDL